MNRVVHFEIQAKDADKVQKFYQDVFGWEISVAAPEYGGYRMIKTGPSMPSADPALMGINGGIPARMGETATGKNDPINAFVCIIGVDNTDVYIQKIKAAGGTIALDKMDVPKVGILAYGKDPEGTLFGILQPSTEMRP